MYCCNSLHITRVTKLRDEKVQLNETKLKCLCLLLLSENREGKRERERERDFSPPLGKTNPPPAGGRRRWRRRGRGARRAAGTTKRGGEEGYPGWSRWWLGAAASKIHRNHTARLHRRSRHLPPPNRNETARVKHPILPPRRSCPATRRSNGQVKNHRRRDDDAD